MICRSLKKLLSMRLSRLFLLLFFALSLCLSFGSSPASAFSVEDYTNLPLFYLHDISFAAVNASISLDRRLPSISYSFHPQPSDKFVTLTNLKLIPTSSYSFKAGDIQKFKIIIEVNDSFLSAFSYCPIANSSTFTLIDCQISSSSYPPSHLRLYSSNPDNYIFEGSSLFFTTDLAIRFDKDTTVNSTSPILFEGGFFRNLPGGYSSGNFTTTSSMGIITVLPQGTFRPKNTQSVQDTVNLNTQAVNNASNQAHSDAQAQKQATDAQTKQDKEQYDAEKKEEADREASAKDEGNGLLGIFNISILNPFAGIWEIFNSGGCTSIPTIAGWVGSEDTVYCSWWPQSIRATLTPVFSIASVMLLFGFVMRWLGGKDGITIDGVDF